MKKNTTGFSIIFALVIVLIASSMSIYLLSFTIPYARNVKSLENSSQAYYHASSAIEESLWDMSENTLWYENTVSFPATATWYTYEIVALWDMIPAVWQWNSDFDADWNTIGFWNPIQLSIWEALISSWGAVDFSFRVPDFDIDGNISSQTLAWWANTPIVNWQLSSSDNTLLPNGTGSFITADDVNNNVSNIDLWSKQWIDLYDATSTFATFYNSNCSWENPCTLKISLFGNMNLSNATATPIPYLEYQIDTGWQSIPTRFTDIFASGKSYGYKKDISVKIPQLTTDQAFDFTVFQ